ncbi:MAG: hypothetical protein ABI723_04815 [Bacteroidia bacterium]
MIKYIYGISYRKVFSTHVALKRETGIIGNAIDTLVILNGQT